MSIRGDHPGPFFVLDTSTPITKPWFVAQLRGILAAVGLPQGQFAGHSFRIGAATTAAPTIQALGRWHSAAFLQYIRTPIRNIWNILKYTSVKDVFLNVFTLTSLSATILPQNQPKSQLAAMSRTLVGTRNPVATRPQPHRC